MDCKRVTITFDPLLHYTNKIEPYSESTIGKINIKNKSTGNYEQILTLHQNDSPSLIDSFQQDMFESLNKKITQRKNEEHSEQNFEEAFNETKSKIIEMDKVYHFTQEQHNIMDHLSNSLGFVEKNNKENGIKLNILFRELKKLNKNSAITPEDYHKQISNIFDRLKEIADIKKLLEKN